MLIGAIDKFTLIDFPEHIAAIIFTQGCNFRCPFCHNPELVLPEKFEDPIPQDEVLKFLESRKKYLDGVEFTGGEPTLQKDLPEMVKKIKEMGFAVKLDTNGTNPEMLKQLFSENLLDYVAMDVKSSLERYDEIAGVKTDTEKIRKSILLIKSHAPDYEFRTTVIKGFHDENEIRKIAELVSGAKKYFIQKPHFDKTVSENFKRPAFTSEEIGLFCEIIKKKTEKCGIR